MATLHVRNVPDGLYKRIRQSARGAKRSLTAEVIQLLGQGLKVREARTRAATIVARIQRRASEFELPGDWTDAVELIREDRSR